MIWSLAIIGLVLKMIFFNEIPESIGISVYLGLGWLGAFSFLAISSRFGLKFVLPLLLGAVFYTIGAVLEFSGAPILIAGVIGSHEIFHIAVIIAIGFHWQFMARIASIESPPLPTVTGVIEEETVDASTLPEYKASTDSLST